MVEQDKEVEKYEDEQKSVAPKGVAALVLISDAMCDAALAESEHAVVSAFRNSCIPGKPTRAGHLLKQAYQLHFFSTNHRFWRFGK